MRYLFIIYCFIQSINVNAQYTLNNDAISIGTDTFQLVPDIPWRNGSVWYEVRQNLDSGFSISGLMNFGDGDEGADGMVFVLQNNCLSAGTAGGGIGYAGLPGNSIGIEFDTWDNEPGLGDLSDPPEDHIAILQNGVLDHASADNLAGPVQMHSTKGDIEDSIWYSYQINYDPTSNLLEVYFDGDLRISYNIDIKNTIFAGDNYVYWGFVSATGAFHNTQNVYINATTSTPTNDTICLGESSSIFLPLLDNLIGQNLAAGKTSSSSSNEGGGSGPPATTNSFDGNMATRWSSDFLDSQWVAVDLGFNANIDSVILQWEAAYGTEYYIQTSSDSITWTNQFYTNTGDGGEDRIYFSANDVRYVRMFGISRATIYGFSLFEFEVYGESLESYAWFPNDGTIDDPTSNNPTFTPTTTTTYTVEIPDFCLGNVVFDYTVYVASDTPRVAISTLNPICEGDLNTFTVIDSSGAGTNPTFDWYLNGIPVGSDSNQYSNGTLINGDSVSVVMTENAECPLYSTDTANITMIVNGSVIPSVVMAPDNNPICDGENVVFTVTDSTGGGTSPSYDWFVNGSLVPSIHNSFSSTSLSDNDSISVVMTSSDICLVTNTDTSSTTITVNPLVTPTVIMTESANNICPGASVTFNVTDSTGGGSNPTFDWYLNGNPVGGDNHNYSSNSLVNNDSISVVMTSNEICPSPSTDTTSVIIMELGSSEMVEITEPNPIECNDDSIEVLISNYISAGSASFQWFVNGIPAKGNSNSLSYDGATEGDEIYVVMNSSAPCSAGPIQSNSVYASESNCGCELFIPNAISPNGDNANDAWQILGLDCWDLWSVKVYNRYGSKVWEDFSYSHSEFYTPWDGIRNGKAMPVAVYYYIVEVQMEGEKSKNYNGSLTIMR